MAKKNNKGMGDTITWKGDVPFTLRGKKKGVKHSIAYRCFCIPEREERRYQTEPFSFRFDLGVVDEIVAAELTREWGNRWPFKLVCNKNIIKFTSPNADCDFTYIHTFYINRNKYVHLVPGQTVQIFKNLFVTSSYP